LQGVVGLRRRLGFDPRRFGLDRRRHRFDDRQRDRARGTSCGRERSATVSAASLAAPVYYSGLRALRIAAVARRLQAAGPILCYHNVVPVEESGIGGIGRVAETLKLVEILRTIHSFDPCLACAVHLLDPERRDIVQVRAL